MSLHDHIDYYERWGCRRCDKMLGIQRMPDGYALMLDADEMYFFWLDGNGGASVAHWDKWAVFRGAKLHSAKKSRAGSPANPDQD